ncbi:ABC transporter, ATP-binding protein [Methanococcoides methylutens MM1]|uniref:ABC transporter, ATP-binding protein n=2 Tax=Methanococcoides methylutens TaxID=2226 RepID=A0A0E3SRZ1_METMT|nr:ABC transporter ATP-binding protein [Methanococcoides methylutens]AKB85178.1 ABC transporter, ATP-binding protein [Methanococcoides methylutens MM1]
METIPVENIEERAVVRATDVCRDYQVGEMTIPILKSVNLLVKEGEFVAIMGPSGSGKSTLMNLIGCLDRPTCGTVVLMGKDVNMISDNELARLRGLEIGFVFQSFNLVPRLTAIENVELPTYANSRSGVDNRKHAIELLELVGLEDRMNYRPTELSGGQSQRVAVARALINDPSLILADEPTGNLDSKTGKEIMDLFTDLNKRGRTIIMITHDPNLAEKYADRVVYLKDGYIESNNDVAN